MTRRFERNRVNPMKMIRHHMSAEDYEHLSKFVTFNPDADWQYRRREQVKHDGTATFTIELLVEAFRPIAERTSFYKKDPPRAGECLHYEVGWIRMMSDFKMVRINGSNMMTQRASMPVRTIRRSAEHG